MWLFTSRGFISIVQHVDDADCLLVRARVRDHLKALFPAAAIVETVDSDYRYRSNVPRKVVQQVLADQVNAINYPNFKNSVSDPAYRSACNRVWGVMRVLQEWPSGSLG
jgi:hypothetical protein